MADDVGSQRLDLALARRELARSRSHAAELIARGSVRVDGEIARKASTAVRDSAAIEVDADPVVSRAAHKLIAALEAFPVTVEGRLALDVGASTGGFTQTLLERGAREVIALDVGHGQLVAELRADERVRVVEGMNARYLDPDSLAVASGTAEKPELVVADLSFISLRMVLPALVGTVGTAADYVLLIKPQFEVGRGGIREGIVREARLRADAIRGVLATAGELGLSASGLVSSPVPGSEGNQEFLVWMTASSEVDPTEWDREIERLA